MKAFIGEAAKWDPDGVSFYVFNNRLQTFPNVTTVAEINAKIATLKPGGGTNTHLAITAAYEEHKKAGSEQTFLMVFTDGEPSDPSAVQKAIVDITKGVKDDKEFRISILTVGERSPDLAKWLDDLDNHLTGAKYDIVKVERLEDVDFEQAIANAIEG
jgi:Mg-chelatase subunit ChlD